MADDILMCLDKASTKTSYGKEAVSKEAKALLRQMMPKQTAGMTNPILIFIKAEKKPSKRAWKFSHFFKSSTTVFHRPVASFF